MIRRQFFLFIAAASAYCLVMIAHLHNPSQGYICDDLDCLSAMPKLVLSLTAAASLAVYVMLGSRSWSTRAVALGIMSFPLVAMISSWSNFWLHMVLAFVTTASLLICIGINQVKGKEGLSLVLGIVILVITTAQVYKLSMSTRRVGDMHAAHAYDVYYGPGRPVVTVMLDQEGKNQHPGVLRLRSERRWGIFLQRTALAMIIVGTTCVLLP